MGRRKLTLYFKCAQCGAQLTAEFFERNYERGFERGKVQETVCNACWRKRDTVIVLCTDDQDVTRLLCENKIGAVVKGKCRR